MTALDNNIIDRSGTKYLRIQIDGVRYLRSLGTSTLTEARGRARDMVKAIRGKRFDALEQTKAKTSSPTIKQVIEAYRPAAAMRGLRPNTIRCNVVALQLVLRTAKGNGSDPSAMRASELTAELVEKYAAVHMGRVLGTGGEQERRARRTVTSTLRQARSLFASWTVGAYRDLHMPDLGGFLEAKPVPPAAVQYVRPPEVLIERTMAAGRELRDENPEFYAVFLLTYDLGLRAGEAVACQWHWFRRLNGHMVLDVGTRGDFQAKGRDRRIPIHDTVWAELEMLPTRGCAHVLPGETFTARENLIRRRFSEWMRGLGWNRATYPKASHELRKLAGSRWYTELGAEVAQTWLGHADVSTTCRYYATLARSPVPLALEVRKLR